MQTPKNFKLPLNQERKDFHPMRIPTLKPRKRVKGSPQTNLEASVFKTPLEPPTFDFNWI